MTKRNDERLAVLETEVKNLSVKINGVENSVQSLHGKFDVFSTTITQNYVAKETFNEYKKNRLLERVLTVLGTAILTGLVAYFFRG